jgi:hypothetical protein
VTAALNEHGGWMAVWKRDEEDKALEKGDRTRYVGGHPSNREEGRGERTSACRRTDALLGGRRQARMCGF